VTSPRLSDPAKLRCCAKGEDADGRRKAATGLSQLAELYAKIDPKLLGDAMRHLGLRLSCRSRSRLAGLVSRCVRPSSSKRQLIVVFQPWSRHWTWSPASNPAPRHCQSFAPKMGIEERIPEFVEEALRARQTSGLTNVLKLMPQSTMEQLASRFKSLQLTRRCRHIQPCAIWGEGRLAISAQHCA